MTETPREPSAQDQSDADFLAQLGILLEQLQADKDAGPTEILPKLQEMSGPRCGTCGGRIIDLDGSQAAEWVHVDSADRDQPHRATHGFGKSSYRA